MEERAMTGEEVLQEILGALNGNGMQQAANGVYELCAYVDSMTKKVEDMTDEISALRDYIQKMEDDKLANKLKKSLNEAADRLEKRCEEIKQQLFEVKESIKNKASDIMADFKMRGKEGSTIVWNKGKYRTVYFTDNLCHELLQYCTEIECSTGVIFSGREKGRPITPGAVWKSLKYIARQVEVPDAMVYPHSFRHLFAKEYMRKIGDISELADLLGHSRLETTWIYTKTTSDEKRRKLELLDL